MEVGGLFAVPTWHLFIRRNPGFILFIMPLWGPSTWDGKASRLLLYRISKLMTAVYHCNLKSALGEKNISSLGRFSTSRARFRSFYLVARSL